MLLSALMPATLDGSTRTSSTPPTNGSRCQPCGTVKVNCPPGPMPLGYRRGNMPVVLSTCDDDQVTQVGRNNRIDVPEFMFWEAVAKAATFSPRTPLSDSDVKAAGALTLSIALGAAAGTAQGNSYLFPGFILEMSTSNNVPAGVVDVDVTGTFEDGQPYTQSLQFSPGHQGVSRFIIMATRESQGGSYPSLISVQRDFILSGPAVSIPLTAAAAPNDATAIVPTNGIRAMQRDFTVTVTQANVDTTFRIEMLSPVGRFWDVMVATFANSVVQ